MTKLSDAYLDTLRGAMLDDVVRSMYGANLTREYDEADHEYLTRVRRIAGSQFAQQLDNKLRERRERIATAAMQGLLGDSTVDLYPDQLALVAINCANALIALLDGVNHDQPE